MRDLRGGRRVPVANRLLICSQLALRHRRLAIVAALAGRIPERPIYGVGGAGVARGGRRRERQARVVSGLRAGFGEGCVMRDAADGRCGDEDAAKRDLALLLLLLLRALT